MLTPRLSGGPIIVNVLPEPVWPYAKMHTLYPSSTDVTRSETSSKTCAWFVLKSKTWSNVHVFSLPLSFATLIEPSCGNVAAMPEPPSRASSVALGGRTGGSTRGCCRAAPARG